MVRALLLIFVPLLIASCGVPRIPGITPYKPEIQQGNYVSQEMISQIKPGMTREQVRFLLGTPLLTDIFHADRWDYVYWRETENGKREHRKVALFFDEGKLARTGGRMGRTLVDAVLADRELTLACAFDVPGSAAVGTKAGAVTIGSDPAAAASCDVLIDFTRPEGTLANLKHARAMVIGTTGFSAAQRKTIAEAAQRIPMVMAANFAVGVNVVFKLAETAAKILGEDYDVEIIEAHHRHKVDAPSGTALKLGEVVAQALNRKLPD